MLKFIISLSQITCIYSTKALKPMIHCAFPELQICKLQCPNLYAHCRMSFRWNNQGILSFRNRFYLPTVFLEAPICQSSVLQNKGMGLPPWALLGLAGPPWASLGLPTPPWASLASLHREQLGIDLKYTAAKVNI